MLLRPHRLKIRANSVLQIKHNLQVFKSSLIRVFPLLKVRNWLPRILEIMNKMTIIASGATHLRVEHLARNGPEVIRFLGDWVHQHIFPLLLSHRSLRCISGYRGRRLDCLHELFDRGVHVCYLRDGS